MDTKRRIIDEYSEEEWEFIHLLNDCYNFANEVFDNLKPEISQQLPYSSIDNLKITTDCLFIKIINTTKAILLLMENHMLVEVAVLLRHQLEALFILRACKVNKYFIEEYLRLSIVNRRKIGNIVTSNDKLYKIDATKRARIKEEIAEIDKAYSAYDMNEKKACKIAGKAKLYELYDSTYHKLCEIVHVGPDSLKDHCVHDSYGNVKSIIAEPYHTNNTKMTFLLSVDILLKSIDTVNQLFELNLGEECGKLNERYEECIKNYPA